MRSPTFHQKAGEISAHITPQKLESEWKDYLRNKLRQNSVPDPIEHLDTHFDIKRVCHRIAEQLANGTYSLKPGHRILVEKSKGLCRQLVLPHPHDALTLQCLTRAFYKDVRSCAPSKNAFFELNQAFSKASLADGTRYGSVEAWLKFQKKIFNFIRPHEFIVVTDIANYYDNIHYDDLRNTLSNHATIRESLLDLMLFILSAMLWQPDYSTRKMIGLPQIDLDAPRLLAHCMLYDLDRWLLSQKSTEFARYMDDLDIGVTSVAQAKQVLKNVDLALQTRHLRLNSGKTKILDYESARHHFKIRENILLSKLETHLKERKKKRRAVRRIRKSMRAVADYCLRNKVFDHGNGEKVLKRIYSISTKQGVKLSDKLLRDTLARRPSVFPHALRHIAQTGFRLADLAYIEGLISTGELVDDMSRMTVATELNSAKMRCTKNSIKGIRSLINAIGCETYFSAYSALWLQTKYADLDELILTIDRTQSFWRADDLLGRMVGGAAPRFLAARYRRPAALVAFDRTIEKSFSHGAIAVRNFHKDLVFRASTYSKVRAFVRKTNDSQVLGITHAKFLMLLSCLSSQTIPGKEKNDLLFEHRACLEDEFYGLHVKDALNN
jgi:hypothetical protein